MSSSGGTGTHGSPASAGQDAPLSVRAVADWFERAPARAPISPLYVAGLVLSALVMAALPLVYVGIVAGIAWLEFRFAVDFSPFTGRRFGVWRLLIAYLAPLAAGVIVLFFMVKPFFARRGRHMRPYEVSINEAPMLHALVHQLCRAVGAPIPKQIVIDCNVNAAAGLRRGLRSLLSDDLVLVIGLPLVEGLTLPEFVGVLAHELGHFTQRGAMRLSIFVRRVSDWFERVVYERDAWDEWLTDARNDTSFLWVQIMFLVAAIGVSLSRGVLWVLMMIGRLTSGFLSRQMEYAADRVEVSVVGAKTFESASVRMIELSLAEHAAHEDLRRAFDGNRLASDLPALVAARSKLLPPDMVEKARAARKSASAGIFSTHPSFGDRVRAAQKFGSAAVFRGEGRATMLFREFHMLCQASTIVYYKEVLGKRASTAELVPWHALVER